jgi:hypothetical protein
MHGLTPLGRGDRVRRTAGEWRPRRGVHGDGVRQTASNAGSGGNSAVLDINHDCRTQIPNQPSHQELTMSYAGPASRARGTTPTESARTAKSSRGAAPGRSTRDGAPSVRPGDDDAWQRLALFGAGLALGIAIGAGAALLTTPRTGAETRATLAAGAGRIRRSTTRRGRDAWDDLRDEIRNATRTLRRRRMRRGLERDAEA